MIHTIPKEPLNRLFVDATAPYKFLWFLSLLDLVCIDDKTEMLVDEVTARMVAKAWYPRLFFRLSYGHSESLTRVIDMLAQAHSWTFDTTQETIVETLLFDQAEMHRCVLKQLGRYVPYRFLSPWIKDGDNFSRICRRTQTFENDCFYALKKRPDGLVLRMNPRWVPYVREHFVVLRDFAFWHWSLFLQSRNPNVPNIVNKLHRPERRSALTSQRHYWRRAIRRMERLPNVYRPAAYFDCDTPFALDHFLPWRFVAHDRLWNLMPIDASLNSAKSDRLPDVEALLPRFALTHRDALRISLHHGDDTACQHDYEDLGYALSEIATMGDESVIEAFRKTYVPLTLIARNMGFEAWDHTCPEPS